MCCDDASYYAFVVVHLLLRGSDFRSIFTMMYSGIQSYYLCRFALQVKEKMMETLHSDMQRSRSETDKIMKLTEAIASPEAYTAMTMGLYNFMTFNKVTPLLFASVR